MVVKRVMFLFLAGCHSWWSVYGQELPLRQEHVFEDQLGRFIRPSLPRFTISPTAAACLFDEVNMWVFHQGGVSKIEEANPTFSAGHKSPYPPRGQSETESWPWSSKFFRNPSTVVWRPGKLICKVSSRGDFWDSSRSNKSISRTCTSQDRSRTAQHGYVPLLVHQSLPIISSCKACMSLYVFGPRNQTRIWLSSTRPSKLWKDGSIPLGPAGINIRCEKEGIPGCFSHALRKSQVAIALGWGPWRAMWWMVKLVTLWAIFKSYVKLPEGGCQLIDVERVNFRNSADTNTWCSTENSFFFGCI